MESKSINRYRSYCRSLRVLQHSCGADPDAPFVLNATAQAFNLTFDLAWKTMKDIIIQHFGVTDFVSGSPRETIRTAFQMNLIDDDNWMKMLQVRNTLVHDYDGEVAKKYFCDIVGEFYCLLEKYRENAATYYGE